MQQGKDACRLPAVPEARLWGWRCLSHAGGRQQDPAQPGCFGPLSRYGLATGPPGARGVNVSGPVRRGVLGAFPPHRGAAAAGCATNTGQAKQQAGEKRGKKRGERKIQRDVVHRSPASPCFWVLCDTSLWCRWAKAWTTPPAHGCTILPWAGGHTVGCGTCHGKGHAAGVMLWEGVRGSGPSLGAQVQHNQQPHWLYPGRAGSTVGAGAPCCGGCPLVPPHGDPSPIPPPLPLLPRRCTLFPVEAPRRRCSLFRWETSPSPPSTLQKKPQMQERREINKQIPSLSWLGICSQSFHY